MTTYTLPFMPVDPDMRFVNEYHLLEALPAGTLVCIRLLNGKEVMPFFGMKTSEPALCGATVTLACRHADHPQFDYHLLKVKPGEIYPGTRVHEPHDAVDHPDGDWLVRRWQDTVFYLADDSIQAEPYRNLDTAIEITAGWHRALSSINNHRILMEAAP